MKKAPGEKLYSKIYGDYPRSSRSNVHLQGRAYPMTGSYRQPRNKFQPTSNLLNSNFPNKNLNQKGSFRKNTLSYNDEIFNYSHSNKPHNQINIYHNPSYNSFKTNPKMQQTQSNNLYKAQYNTYKKPNNQSYLQDIRSPPSSKPYHDFNKMEKIEQYEDNDIYRQPNFNDFQLKGNSLMHSRSHMTSPKQNMNKMKPSMKVLASEQSKTYISSYQDDCFYMNLEEEYLHLVNKRNQNKFSNRSMHTMN